MPENQTDLKARCGHQLKDAIDDDRAPPTFDFRAPVNHQAAALGAAKRGADVTGAYANHDAAVSPDLARYAVHPGDLAQIAQAFGYNAAPSASQAVRMQAVRDAFSALALACAGLCPRGRLYSLGMTDLERSSHSLIKAIASEVEPATTATPPPAP